MSFTPSSRSTALLYYNMWDNIETQYMRKPALQISGDNDRLFNKRHWDNWLFTEQNMKLDCYFMPDTKINFK